MPTKPHALIVGSGIGGPACALSLEALGYTVSMVEAQSVRSKKGAALLIAPNGMTVLGRLGLAEQIRATGNAIDRFSFLSQRGRRIATMRISPEGRYRYPGISISRARLNNILVEAVSRKDIEINYGKRLTDIRQSANGVTASFFDGDEIRADIMIGADGIRSSVRQLVFPEAPEPSFTGLIGGGGFVSRSTLSRLLGSCQESVMTFSAGDGAFFGFAFGDRTEECGAYWWYSLRQKHPLSDQDRYALEGDRAARIVLKAGKGWSRLVREIVAATTMYIPPLDIYDVAPLPRWSNNRVVLVGDAAHAVAPHSGQGASMALEDAAVLGARLNANRNNPAAAFKAFEYDRRPRTERVVEMGRRTGEQKAKGWLSARFQTLMMPLYFKLAPPQDWLFGYEPQ